MVIVLLSHKSDTAFSFAEDIIKLIFPTCQIRPRAVVENPWKHLQKEDNQLADWLGESNASINL